MSESEKNMVLDPYVESQRLKATSKIMMIDDEPINMQILQLLLEASGYELFSLLKDSTQAMERLRAEHPSVLLLDLNMPVVSGIDILKLIRADPELAQTPVIVLTSSNDPDTKVQALTSGATDYLSKPVDGTELALRVRNTLAARAYQQRILYYDLLTHLPNRRFFSELVQRLIVSGIVGRMPKALLMLNLDSIKSIRDTYGQERSDDLLWMLSQRLQTLFDSAGESQPSSTMDVDQTLSIVRLAGDRFGLLLPVEETLQHDPALIVRINALVESLATPFVLDAQQVYLRISMGIASLDKNTVNVDHLLDQAETAMLYAQLNDDEVYAFYTKEMTERSGRNLRIENGLRGSLEKNELQIVYQPKYEVATSCISGCEALLRWQSPELGAMSPVEFIPIAESSGLIVPIGDWVLKQSCIQGEVFRAMVSSEFQMAVNVSIRQVQEAGFIDSVQQALDESGLPAESLTLEITENILMEDPDACAKKLSALKEMGVKVSIDDFGTGYSSLSYLQDLPISQLKIDQSFIRKIQSHDEPIPIVKAIVSMAHDLGMAVVAEGVETALQLECLRSLRCEQFQGYLMSKPIPVDELTTLLQLDATKAA